MRKHQKIVCGVLICSILLSLLTTSLAQQVDTTVRSDLKVSVLSDSLDVRQGAIACNREDQYRVVTQDLSLQDMYDDPDSVALVVEKDYYDSVSITDRAKMKKKIREEFNNKKRVCFMGDKSNLDPNQILLIFNDSNDCIVSSEVAADEELIAVVYRLDEIGRPILATYSRTKDRVMSGEEEVSFVLNNSFECSSQKPAEKVTALVDVYDSALHDPIFQRIDASTRMNVALSFEYGRAARGNNGTMWDVKVTSIVSPLGEYRTVFVKNRMTKYNFNTSYDETLMDYWPETGVPTGTKTFGYSGSDTVGVSTSGGTNGFNIEGTMLHDEGWSYTYQTTWSGVNVEVTSNGLNPADNIEVVYNFTDSSARTTQKLTSGSRWWNPSGLFQTRYHSTFYVGDEIRELGQNIAVLDIRTYHK